MDRASCAGGVEPHFVNATVGAERELVRAASVKDVVPDEMPSGEPPPDPEDWSDEQWIEWLKRTDAADGEDVSRPVTAFGRIAHSSGGSVLGQAMLGMANAIYGRNDNEVVIVVDGSSQPDADKPFSVRLDPDHPERSVVVFRSQPPDHPTGESARG